VGDQLEVIHGQMEDTRASLTDKLETLENKVRDAVEEATDAVQHTVETVQETVHDVKEGLAHTFDIRAHVEHRPWLMMGGAVVAGYLGGRMTGESRQEREVAHAGQESLDCSFHNGAGEYEERRQEPAEEHKEGPIQAGLNVVKGLAVGTVMQLLRQLVTQSLPNEWVPKVVDVVDEITTKLGGTPIHSTDDSMAGEMHHVERDNAEMGRPLGAARGSDQGYLG